MHVIVFICVCKFRGRNSFKGGGGEERECETREKLNFSKERQNNNLPLKYRLIT